MTEHPKPHDTIGDDVNNDDAHGPLRSPLLMSSGPQPRPAVRRKAIVRFAILIIAVNQIITTAFAFVVRRNHPDVALGLTTLFSMVLCVMLSAWIRSGAKHAYQNACERGYASDLAGPARSVRIAPGCPRRLLVVLYVELQGRTVVHEYAA
jgi:hypothetical protein